MNKIILTDADGVLLNWNEAFDNFMESKGFPRLDGTDSEYSISVRHGIDKMSAIGFVREFNEGEHVKYLAPFADSVEYVTKLSELGFRFIVVTSISDHPASAVYRTENLTDLFGNVFDEINCIAMGANKFETLKRWKDTGYFWIEDHIKQAEAGTENGLRSVIISHPYNEEYDGERVGATEPWKEIYHRVRSEYAFSI